MKKIEPISVETARELVDFSGSSLSVSLANDQLEGAVAIHNIIAKHGFAYLADEVGMGKTYVALGVVGLLRFFNPGIRVLYIAPRENIQSKWVKELKNFTRNNWKNVDQRVKSIQGTPPVEVVKCENLADWARQSVRNPNRDFFLRISSFSFPLSADREKWHAKREEIKKLAYMISHSQFDLRDKEHFKQTYARTINTLLPHYDLVIIDEAHNLKGGRQSGSSRNRILNTVLGCAEDDLEYSPNYGKRFDRVLLLSATPVETDYAEVWRQLDLFGFGEKIEKLNDRETEEDAKKEIVSRFLVRRLTGLVIAGKTHTKNMYRREWRGGGCVVHDEPLSVPDPRQRLIVALVQKKVAEVLDNPRFNASFQIGMLSSFESFLETAKVKTNDEEEQQIFDQTEQTEDDLEREGIDTFAVNRLAESYRKEFGHPLPHPKMDSIVSSLKQSFDTGTKSLVFVRRIKSVAELKEKLCREYDAWLRQQLLAALPDELHPEFEQVWNEYESERRTRASLSDEPAFNDRSDMTPDGEALFVEQEEQADEDEGGMDTFFAWFFRGEGPAKYLSGAAFRKNRLQGTGSAYSTFFEDNYVAMLIGVSGDVFDDLAAELGSSPEELTASLRDSAFNVYRRISKQKKFPRYAVFHAYQAAALMLLASRSGAFTQGALAILRERYPGDLHQQSLVVPDRFPDPRDYINTRTFFTELRLRPDLRKELWHQPSGKTFAECFIEGERRRELLSAVARLGHAFIDLWALFVTRIESLQLRAQERTGERAELLIEDYLNRLEEQRAGGFNAYRELSEVGRNYSLIFDVNFPEAARMPLSQLARFFGRALSKQTPVGGMFGGINSVLVRQFRMPGYPTVLITTDVLQEGEDLHTFCSRIVHYGISWTPSAMEQRTGRVDRIGSLTHRRLDNRDTGAGVDELLQVYYPYLADTVELLQVERVFERMNRFIHLVHKVGAVESDSKLDTRVEFVRSRRNIGQITAQLESAFPVKEEYLAGSHRSPREIIQRTEKALEHFRKIGEGLETRVRIEWEDRADRAALYGTAFTDRGELLARGDDREPGRGEVRRQPFALLLRGASIDGHLLLHAISPVGKVSLDDLSAEWVVRLAGEIRGAKVCEVPGSDAESYTLTVEGDIVFDDEMTQIEEVNDLLNRVCIAADWLERRCLGETDEKFETFRKDLHREAHRVTD